MRTLFAAAPWWSGIKHRFKTLNQALAFARHMGYELTFVWGISEGVGYCRYADLLAPIPGVRVINVSESELKEIEAVYRRSKSLSIRDQRLVVHSPGSKVGDRTFAFDLWGDFAETTSLFRQLPLSLQATEPIKASPCSELQKRADAFVKDHNVASRIGIRVRVTENPTDGRSLCRVQAKLDGAIKSIIRLPWHIRAFIVTDSQYVQQMLASHFIDSRFLPKRFSEIDKGQRYIDRKDPAAMRTYMMEIACLTACRNILNYGGFINQESVADRIIEPNCHRDLFGLRRAAQS